MTRPAIFDTRPAAVVITEHSSSPRWLIVDATADWCQPCKLMERTTWRDAAVESWLRENAIAVALDIDTEKDLAERLGIRSVPTVMAFRQGVEFDRVQGLRRAEDFLRWLTGLQRGERDIDKTRQAVKAPNDVQARYKLACDLVATRSWGEATEECEWLWEHMLEHEPGMYGVRLSFFVAPLSELVAAHAPARSRFTTFRDALDQTVRAAQVTREALEDWVTLNRVLREEGRTLAWFDDVKREAAMLHALQREEHLLGPLLLSRGRWSDAGMLYADPVKTLQRHQELMTGAPVPEYMAKEFAEVRKSIFRDLASRMCAALSAASRGDDARRARQEALRFDDSAAMLRAMEEADKLARAGTAVTATD